MPHQRKPNTAARKQTPTRGPDTTRPDPSDASGDPDDGDPGQTQNDYRASRSNPPRAILQSRGTGRTEPARA